MYKNATIYYPASEIHTPLIPVTAGCPHNKCVFCSMYKGDEYEEVPLEDIEYELKNLPEYAERVFLTGADPLNIGFEKMMVVLKMIKKYAPYLGFVVAYASVRAISKYTVEELKELHKAGLSLLYIGFESGWDEPLKLMNKGHTVEQAIEQGKKLNEAKISFNSIVMYGIAGEGKGIENARRTARMLNEFHSYRIVTMNLSVFDMTPLARMVEKGMFKPASSKERLEEVKTLLENLEVQKSTLFDTTHVTNILKLQGTLPEDRVKLIGMIPKLDK